MRKLVKPLQGRDRETRPIRGAIPRTHRSLEYAVAPRELDNAAASTIEILRYFQITSDLSAIYNSEYPSVEKYYCRGRPRQNFQTAAVLSSISLRYFSGATRLILCYLTKNRILFAAFTRGITTSRKRSVRSQGGSRGHFETENHTYRWKLKTYYLHI